MVRSPANRVGWRWMLVALGFLSWLSLGCSPASITGMILPFASDKIDPEIGGGYKLFSKESTWFGKEEQLTLVLIVDFAQPPFDEDIVAVKSELHDRLAQFFRKRCHENKQKIKIATQSEVNGLVVKQRAERNFDPVEIGKQVKADFVLDLQINSCSLYEKNRHPKEFLGSADAMVKLFKVDAEDDPQVFVKPMQFRVTNKLVGVGLDTNPTNVAAFRHLFTTRMARDVTKLFIAFPQEEKNSMD